MHTISGKCITELAIENIQKEKEHSAICTDTVSGWNNFSGYERLGKNLVVHCFDTLTEVLGTENTLKEVKV
jgi:hypothetical protein